jgi:type IV pilus assembly protein PilV
MSVINMSPLMRYNKNPSTTRHSGFTLLEVLVAVIVISIGLLGLAGLQARGMQANHSSMLRTVATYQAYDMADRMRANIKGVNNGDYNNLSGIPTDPACVTTSCTPTNMATTDLYHWNTTNSVLLPAGQGVVCLDSTPDDGTQSAPGCDGLGTLYAIKLWWVDDRSGNPTRFVVSFRP